MTIEYKSGPEQSAMTPSLPSSVATDNLLILTVVRREDNWWRRLWNYVTFRLLRARGGEDMSTAPVIGYDPARDPDVAVRTTMRQRPDGVFVVEKIEQWVDGRWIEIVELKDITNAP